MQKTFGENVQFIYAQFVFSRIECLNFNGREMQAVNHLPLVDPNIRSSLVHFSGCFVNALSRRPTEEDADNNRSTGRLCFCWSPFGFTELRVRKFSDHSQSRGELCSNDVLDQNDGESLRLLKITLISR